MSRRMKFSDHRDISPSVERTPKRKAQAGRWGGGLRARWWPAVLLGALFSVLPSARPLPVHATDGLYGAGAPADAAFVRVVNAAGEGAIGSLWIGATEFSAVADLTVSPYRPLSPGIHQISISGHTEELVPSAGGYYTVVYTEEGLTVLRDTEHTRPDRAQIVLYNFSSEEGLELRTADGAATAVPAVPRRTGRDIAVNPIRIEFAIYHRGEPLETVGDLGLERGQSYGVFVFGELGDARVVIERAELALE